MGNLSNLYVSRSFQSLIHLATDNTASANLIGLEDGYGNPIGVSVNTAGDLSISGSLTASLQSGYVWVGNGSGKTTIVATASFAGGVPVGTATTGSNTFIGDQTITGSVSISGNITIAGNTNITPASVSTSATYPLIFVSGSTISKDSIDTIFYNPSTNVLFISASTGNLQLSTTGTNITSGSGNGLFATVTTKNAITNQSGAGQYISISGNPSQVGAALAGFTRPGIMALSGSGVPYVPVEFQASGSSFTDGRVTFNRNVAMLQNLEITGSLTASAAKISGLNYPTADNGAESFIQTDGAGNLSLQYVKTIYQSIRNAETSSIVKGTPLFVSGSTGDNADVYIADALNPNRMPATLIAGDATLAASATGKGIIFGHIQGVDTTGYPAGTEVYVGPGGGWTATRPTGSSTPIQPLGVVTREGTNGMGIVLTQVPFDLPNIQTGYTWVGNGNNQPIAVATSSFGGGSGAGFPYTGSAQITGSLGITGSLSGLPITLSVVANTASIDMNAGNQFVLTLPSSSTTHIAPSSIKAGQTINLLIKQQIGPATGSITFAPSILFPSGLDMQATSTGSAIDLVSMISFDTTNLIAANVKNLK